MFLRSFFRSLLPHKSVNLSCILVIVKDVDEFVGELTSANDLKKHFVIDHNVRATVCVFGFSRLLRVLLLSQLGTNKMLSQLGTYKTVKARFWPWLSG